MQLQFLGANRQVTGSRYLLEAAGLRIMIDCGLVQERAFLARNWQTSPVDPKSITHVLLTHAHLDHVGLLPRLVSHGYAGQVITTEPTVELARIVMTDAAKIQEEDAAYKLRRHEREHRQGPHPVQPLYRAEDAENAGKLLRGVPYNQPVKLNDHVTVTFHEAGHILGSAAISISVREQGGERVIVFSGDLGQWDKPFIRDPQLLTRADYVVMESTYGDRNHMNAQQPQRQLKDIVNSTIMRGGNVVIPTFAIERAQEIIYYLSQLVHRKQIPDVPIYLDSPMAVDVTQVFHRYEHYMDEHTRALFENHQSPLHFPSLHMVRDVEDSKAINERAGSCIIMSTSGMCTAGRIKHHLRHNIVRPDSTILFVGYQAVGTLGRQIVDRMNPVRIHGRFHPVRARIEQILGFSAHADRDDLIRWLTSFTPAPRQVFLTHGEQSVSLQLADTLRSQLNFNVTVPEYEQTVSLDDAPGSPGSPD